jgi:methionyl-tRNA formyltransferase
MVPQLDSGDILWQHEEKIGERGTRELWETWAETSARALPDLVRNYETLKPSSQDESLVTHCGKFKKADGEVFPEKETAEEIMRKKRAFDVWPGIFVTTKEGIVKIETCSLQETKNSVALPCKNGTTLWLQTIQLSGKSGAAAADVLRGRPNLFRR